MHQQEILRVCLLPYLLRHARRHRYSRNTGGADQRIDLAVRQLTHQLPKQNTAGCRKTKRNQPQQNNTERLQRKKVCRFRSGSNRNAEKDRYNIAQLVLHGLAQTIGNPALS